MPSNPSVPGKFYRDSSKMRNLRATFARTRSHAVRMTILKEMYAECQRLAHRGRTRARNTALAIRRGAVAARKGGGWTFRKIGDGAVRGAQGGRKGAAWVRTRTVTTIAAKRQIKQAQRGQQAQAQATRRKAAAGQTRTPKLTRLVNPAPPGLTPAQKGARTRAANRAAAQPAAQGSRTPPLPSEIGHPARAPRSRGPAPGNPAGVARKPQSRKRTK